MLMAKSSEMKHSLVIILGGYENEMQELMKSNSGLASRFLVRVHFPDYAPEELIEIAKRMAKNANMELAPDALSLLETKLLAESLKSNARDVENLMETAGRKRDSRVHPLAKGRPDLRGDKKLLTTVTADDLKLAAAGLVPFRDRV